MHHGFLLITANTESPNYPLFFLGIGLGLLFFLIGFLIGWSVWRRCHREVVRFEDENRKFTRSARLREKTFLKQQEKIARLTKKD